jgi:SAM-dependent methyltransferase
MAPATESQRRQHWDEKYSSTGATSVSWYQPEPTMSLSLLHALGLGPDTSLVDVGGGASTLVDHLVAAGWRDVTVLDVSPAALRTARERLPRDAAVTWLAEDLLSWRPERMFGVWHDRAVFHFLTEEADRDRYREALDAAVAPGGTVILAAFAEDGPTMCSGLPVRRYAHPELLAELGSGFEPVQTRREVHRTPAGGEQAFTWVVARRRG